jgi:hypothetical protein
MRLWASLWYRTAVCLGVLRKTTKRLRFLYPGPDSNWTPPKHIRRATTVDNVKPLRHIPRYRELMSHELVVHAGHVVVLQESVQRCIDRRGQISKRNAQEENSSTKMRTG